MQTGLGAGSAMATPVTSLVAFALGCRVVALMSGAFVCLVLPGLAVALTPTLLGATLFAFGAALGTLDVAINVQAVIVKRDSGGSLMSGFHGLFSVAGFIGAGLMAFEVMGWFESCRMTR